MKRIIGIYMAAGKSSRMGVDKLQLPIGRSRVGSRALLAAVRSNLEHIVVVTPTSGDPPWVDSELRREPFDKKWSLIPSSNSDQGQAYSLRSGLKAAYRREPDAVMILLADQPFVTSSQMNALIASYERTPESSYIASSYKGIPMPPVILDRMLFPEMEKLQGDEGARKILSRMSLQGKLHCFDDPLWYYDVDTQQDYERLLQLHIP